MQVNKKAINVVYFAPTVNCSFKKILKKTNSVVHSRFTPVVDYIKQSNNYRQEVCRIFKD